MLNLNKLQVKIDNALESETNLSLTDWLKSKRQHEFNNLPVNKVLEDES